MLATLRWKDNALILVDQTKLPVSIEYIICLDYRRVNLAIQRLEVRGAPALGAAGAYAMVLAFQELMKQQNTITYSQLSTKYELMRQEIIKTRPTAVNLAWAVNLVWDVFQHQINITTNLTDILTQLLIKANQIFENDIEQNKQIGLYGSQLLPENATLLTHCNAGALATCGFGTALGVIRQAYAENKIKMVYVDETRPLLQGARLTAWELQQEGIPATLISDNMAAWVMKTRNIDCVITGADRITENGDTANKIGTYGLAVLAKEHNIPFYVAAPLSTFDFSLTSGTEIPIEERAADELRYLGSQQIAPLDIKVFNPAFDVTPHQYITGIITEVGVVKAPYTISIKTLKARKKERIFNE